MLQKQVRRPLIVVASFTWLLRAEQEPFLPTDLNHNNSLSVSPTLVESDSMNMVLSEDQKAITILRCAF